MQEEIVNSPYANLKLEYREGLCACCSHPLSCCYVAFCYWCAVADLAMIPDNKDCFNLSGCIRWLLVFVSVAISAIAPPVSAIIFIIILLKVDGYIAARMNWFDNSENVSVVCILEYWCCFPCKMCQVANQLNFRTVEEVKPFPKAVPLILNANKICGFLIRKPKGLEEFARQLEAAKYQNENGMQVFDEEQIPVEDRLV